MPSRSVIRNKIGTDKPPSTDDVVQALRKDIDQQTESLHKRQEVTPYETNNEPTNDGCVHVEPEYKVIYQRNFDMSDLCNSRDAPGTEGMPQVSSLM